MVEEIIIIDDKTIKITNLCTGLKHPSVIDLKIGKLPHNPHTLVKKPYLTTVTKTSTSFTKGIKIAGHSILDTDGNLVSHS